MSNQSRLPIFWAAIFFVLGIVLFIWGHYKDQSTIPSRTVGSVPMMIVGVTMVVASVIGFFSFGNKK